MIKFTVPGTPKAKARPRMSTKTGHAYTPKDTILYENWVKQCYIEATTVNERMKDGNIGARVVACFKVPKSTSKKKQVEMLEGKIRPCVKPDTDNIAKIILDSLNGIAYTDDKNIVDLRVEKYYSEEPRVEVTLYEITK